LCHSLIQVPSTYQGGEFLLQLPQLPQKEKLEEKGELEDIDVG
jgi:hypothetical protein